MNIYFRILLVSIVASSSINYVKNLPHHVPHAQIELVGNEYQPIDIDPLDFSIPKEPSVARVGKDLIEISGPITPETYTKFKALFNDQIKTVSIASPGGDVEASVEISKIIYNNSVDTLVPDRAGCFSGCTLIFQAGTNRTAYSNTLLGYHYAVAVLKDGDEKTSAYGTGVYWSYLAYYRLKPTLLERLDDKYTDYFISPKDSMKYNIVTTIIPVDNGD